MVTIHAHATTMSLTLNRRKLASCSMAACIGSKDGYPLHMRAIGNRYVESVIIVRRHSSVRRHIQASLVPRPVLAFTLGLGTRDYCEDV